MYAILGGSGLAKLSVLQNIRRQVMRTPYGEPSGALTIGTLAGREVVFLARHGYGHTLPPHEINYRANIWALQQMGVRGVIAVASVGGIREDLGPGTLVVPHQIIDYTHSRKHTFFSGAEAAVVHVDFTQPYAPRMRALLLESARSCADSAVDGAVYACTQGPRLETAAEVEKIARDGGDVVGMTGMPEAALAREADLEYAALCVVVNHAAGRGTSKEQIKLADLDEVLHATIQRAVKIVECAVGAAS
jgi:5'-methylthioadenosine phosphorylase